MNGGPARTGRFATLLRAAWPLTFAALFAAATIATVKPRNLVWRGGLLGSARFGHATGDYTQLTYYLWLWRHALVTRAHGPWVDPFQFAATGHVTTHPFGWPLVILSLPVNAVSGPFAAYNAVVFASFAAAGIATYLWLRELDCSRAAATVGAFAYAFAPFLLSQLGHLNQLLAFLVPLCFFFAERALRSPIDRRWAGWGLAITYLSLAGSGEMHLVLFVTPVLALYIVVRSVRAPAGNVRSLVLPLLVTAAGAALLLTTTYFLVLDRSVRASTVPLATVQTKTPQLANIGQRTFEGERTTYPGAVIVVLAAGGLVAALGRQKNRLIGPASAVAAVAAYALAFAPRGDPAVVRLYRSIPFFAHVKVPGRVIIVAVLALAVLAAFALDLIKWTPLRWVLAAVAIAALMFDSSPFRHNLNRVPLEPDAFATIPANASVLDLPPLSYRNVAGSAYAVQIMYHPGPRVGGYSVFVTPRAFAAQRETRKLHRLPIDACRWLDVLQEVDFRYVAVYTDLFGDDPLQGKGDGEAIVAALADTPGFRPVSRRRDIAIFRFDPDALICESTNRR